MKKALSVIEHYVRSNWSTLAILGVVIGGFWCGYFLVYQRVYTFSFTNNNCFRDVTLLPTLHRSRGSGEFALTLTDTKSFAGHPVIARKTCVSPLKAPQGKTVRKVGLSFLGISVPGKRFAVRVASLPVLNEDSMADKISVRDSLRLTLNQPDELFSYQIKADQKKSGCRVQDSRLTCDVQGLGLAQNKKYSVDVMRYFQENPVDQVIEKTVETTNPVTIKSISISKDSVVYDEPKSVVVATNKDIESARVDLLKVEKDGKTSAVELKTSFEGANITMGFEKPLSRKAVYKIEIKDVVAKDRGLLAEEYSQSFRTSGGPQVSGVNIGASSVENDKTIVVNFDQPLKTDQDIKKLISLGVSDKSVSFSATVQRNQISITPKDNFPLCATISLKLNGNIVSNYGIGGDSAKTVLSRAKCYSISTIGYSVKGAPINMWRFGSGAKKILYVAATHGNEQSTKFLLEEWIKELDSNAQKLPVDKTIMIIPELNPDGVAAGNRRNANGIDLNRNFPANDWKSDVTMPGGELVSSGAGSLPLSEPESQALSKTILAERPNLVITYHSSASIVSGNDSGSSNSLASDYARTSGYKYLPKSDTNIIFQYDTTGAFEDWLHDKLGIPAMLIELGSSTRSEFSKNKPAMWNVLNTF